MISADYNAKISARHDFQYFIAKVLYVVSAIFFSGESFSEVYMAVVILISFFLFEKFSLNMENHNFLMSKIITAQHACECWTSLCLVLAALSLSYNFSSSLLLWILGLPLTVLIVLMRQENLYYVLLMDTNNYNVLQEPLM